MPTLVIPHPGRGRIEHPITADTITIGRANENTIPIRDDSVSSRHAKLTRKSGQYHLEDLDSTNGCYVNNRLVKEVDLETACSIRLGSVLCEFRLDDVSDDPIADQFSSFQKELQSVLAERNEAERYRRVAENSRLQAQQQISKLKADNEGKRKEAAELHEKLAAAEKRIESTTRETRDLRDTGDRDERKFEEQTRELMKLTEQRDSANLLAEQAQAKLLETTQKLATANSDLVSLRKEITDLESRTGSHASYIESLTAQRDDLQRSNDQLSAKLAESRQRVDSVTRQHEKASKELAESKADLEGLLDGAETVMSWFERIARRGVAAAAHTGTPPSEEPPPGALPPRIEKPIRAEGAGSSEELDDRRVTRKITPPLPPGGVQSEKSTPASSGQTQRIELPRASEASVQDQLAPLITQIGAHLTRFKANRNDLSPLHDVLRDSYNLTRSTSKLGSTPLFNLASEFEALIRDIQHMPTRIHDGSLRTLDDAVALMKTVLQEEHFERSLQLPDGNILAIGSNEKMRISVVATMNSVNLKTYWVEKFSDAALDPTSAPLDLVLLDEASRGHNGDDPCRLLRQTPANAKTPILLIVPSEKSGVTDSTVSDCIHTPFSHRELAVKALTWRLKSQLGLV